MTPSPEIAVCLTCSRATCPNGGDRSCPWGKLHWARERAREWRRAYRVRNRERLNAQHRAYVARNRERVNAQKRARYWRRKAEGLRP